MQHNTHATQHPCNTTPIQHHAHRCGHCKKMAGAYESLGAQLHDLASITVAEVDCTAGDNRDLCSDQQVGE